MEGYLPIPDFPNYTYNPETNLVYSKRSKKHLTSRFTGSRTKFELYRNNKCYTRYDDQLIEITTGKKKPPVPGKIIKGFPNYTVTQDGAIYTKATGIRLKLQGGDGDYVSCGLYKNSKASHLKVHVLVAIAYIPNPKKLPEVDHINGHKDDNRVENLEWVTRSENISRAFKLGLNKGSKRKVLQIEIYHEEGEKRIYKSMAEAVRETGASGGAVCTACKKGNIYKEKRWGYVDKEHRPGVATKIFSIDMIAKERLVSDYESAEEAGKAMDIHPSNITNACRGRHKLAKGYRWEYFDTRKDDVVDPEWLKTWKVIPHFSNYKISKDGDVYTLVYHRLLSPSVIAGYKCLRLIRDDGERKAMKIHRLVCLAYRDNLENKRIVNHIDGKKSNNVLDNLEWNTDQENVRHAYKTGLCGNRKRVIQYTLDMKEVCRYKSAVKAAKELGVHNSTISNACRGYINTCKGFIFRYAEDVE